MAIDRTWYNSLVDDDGSNTVGTVWGKDDVDALMDATDAEIARTATGAVVNFSPVTGGDTRMNAWGSAAYCVSNKMVTLAMMVTDCFLVADNNTLHWYIPTAMPTHFSVGPAFLNVFGIWELGVVLLIPGNTMFNIHRSGLAAFPSYSTMQLYITASYFVG